MNSPFSSSPGTTAPQASITNLNVLVSGQNIYQSNYMYDFEEFLQEVHGSNAINGGISLGLSSGLLSQNDWENGYRFCYVDLSRRISQPNDDISRSIQVMFTNSANYATDYYFIIGFEKSITISTSTGSLIMSEHHEDICVCHIACVCFLAIQLLTAALLIHSSLANESNLHCWELPFRTAFLYFKNWGELK